MPFGIASGQEEYQRRHHEFLDGLRGVINIADDICVYGCGNTKEDADIDYDRILVQLLEKCAEHDQLLSGKNLLLKPPYINDLPNCLMHSQPRMYADDTSITYASNDVEEIERCVNIDLDRIRIWLAANKLTLNTSKTEFLWV